MARNQIQVDEIIDYMNTLVPITNLVWNRIYFGLPFDEVDTSWPYITINIVSEVNQEYSKWTLLEFRYIADANSTFKNLMDIREVVINQLTWIRNFGNMKVYGVIEESVRQWYDTKNQKNIIQDMRFYFVS